MATIKDVAERAGVTVTTVSRMLNGRVPVSEKTTKRIHQAMDELGYHPNEAARALAKKSSNVIGLIVPSAENFFFSSVIHSVERHACRHDCKVLLCVSNLDTEKEIDYAYEVMEAIELAKRQGKGAIALHGKMIDAPIVARAQRTIDMAKALGLGREDAE